MIVHVKSVSEFEEIIQKEEVLVDFFATWCGPCNMLSPVIEKVAAAHPELTVAKIDVDEVGELAQKYGVSSIPTLLRFESGVQKDRALGFMPEQRLLAFLGK